MLPLVLAALHEELGRGLVVLLAEDADARDAAEAAAWFLGDEQVGALPVARRPLGLRASSRRRTSSASGRARSRCSSGAGSSAPPRPRSRRGCRRPLARPAPLARRAAATSRGSTSLAEQLASAGYERVERVEERGQFAVRGGLVDVFPTTGREPLRIELFGDEIEQIRAFSPFTQRALRQVDEATDLPGRRAPARARRDRPRPGGRGEDAPPRRPRRSRAAVRPRARPRLAARRGARGLGRGGAAPASPLDGAAELTPLPQGQPFSFDAQRPGARGARARRGRERARRPAAPGARRRRRVPAPRRGAAPAAAPAPRRRRRCSSRARRPTGLTFAVSPARRGFVWRELGVALLPDTQVFRKRPPRATAAPGRALQSFSDLRTGDYVVHEDHGIAQLLGFETKEVAGVTRDYLLLAFRGDDRVYVPHEQIGKVSRYIGADAKAPALSKLGGKAWDNLKTRAREHLREMAGELLQLYAQRQTQPGRRLRRRPRVGRAARERVPVPRDRGPAHARSRR